MQIIKYYEIEEVFEDIDEVTIDLFKRHEFDIEDVDNLKDLKKNLQELIKEIDVKIDDIYSEHIDF